MKPPPAEQPEPVPSPSAWRGAVAVGLLLVGVVLWLTLGQRKAGPIEAWIALAITAVVSVAISAWPKARQRGGAIVERLRFPRRRTRMIVAAAIAIGAAIFFMTTAISQQREIGPVLHDEHCYMIQARMLAEGRLWMPRHELGDFFESFHLITDRVYAAKYSPGTALFGVPAVWLNADLWTIAFVLTSIAVALFYLVLAEMIDGLAALLGALALPALSVVRRISLEFISEAPMLFLLLVAIYGFLRWRRTKAIGWMIAIGVAVGWSAITRPVDAVCLSVPLIIAIGLELKQLGTRRRIVCVAALALPMLPFLALQLICDKGITGHWTQLPWSYYAQRLSPYDSLSRQPFDPARRSTSVVPEMQKFEETFVIPAYKERLATPYVSRAVNYVAKRLATVALPNPLLLILVPCCLMALRPGGRWVLPGVLPVFVALYALYSFFLDQYAVAAAPALILCVMLGWDSLSSLARGRALRCPLGAMIATVILFAYPQLQLDPPTDAWPFAPILRLIDAKLAALDRTPAIVLFHFDLVHLSPHVEPVYNTDVAWPDDAPIIRAHDLGEARDRQLFAYYAKRYRENGQPDRAVYRYDLSTSGLVQGPQYLGRVSELAGH